MSVVLQLWVALLCLAGEAFFAGMETGIISIHRMRLRHFVRQGAAGAKLLQGYIENPDRLLGTTLVGTNICVVIESVAVASLAVHFLGGMGEAMATGAVALVALVFGEYLPKAWFHSRPLSRCSRYVHLLRGAEVVFRPISRALIWLTSRMVHDGRGAFGQHAPFVTKEDLKVLAQQGEQDGVLSPRERWMIHRVIELPRRRARDILVPRAEMTTVDRATTVRGFLDVARRSEFTRIPVIDREQDRFVGVVNVFHVLAHARDNLDQGVDRFMSKPLFVDEDMAADDILPRLRRFRQPMCFVRDKSGRVLGLITTEDILEEIVGEL